MAQKRFLIGGLAFIGMGLVFAILVISAPYREVQRLRARFDAVEIGMTKEQMLATMASTPAATSAVPDFERGGYEGLEDRSVTAVVYSVPVLLNCQIYEFVIDSNDIVIAKAAYD